MLFSTQKNCSFLWLFSRFYLPNGTSWLLSLSKQEKLDTNVHMMPKKQSSMKWLSSHIQKHFYKISCSLEHQIPKSLILSQSDCFWWKPPIKPIFVEIVQIDEKIYRFVVWWLYPVSKKVQSDIKGRNYIKHKFTHLDFRSVYFRHEVWLEHQQKVQIGTTQRPTFHII